MGWASGENAKGRPVGYSVRATCDEPGCTTVIDRGLDYVCGGMHDGGEVGCGLYFCGPHHAGTRREPAPSGRYVDVCAKCLAKTPDEDEGDGG